MSRLNVAMALVLIACALAVIQAQHRSRTYFVELERLKKEARALEEQWGQLQLEQSTWANPARVDSLARSRVGLVPATQERIHVVAENADTRVAQP